MRRIRKLSTLYKILGNVEFKSEDESGLNGICVKIGIISNDDLISEEEYDKLHIHFKNQRPTKIKYSKFYDKRRDSYVYWWDIKKCEIRREFIEMLRKQCRKEKI